MSGDPADIRHPDGGFRRLYIPVDDIPGRIRDVLTGNRGHLGSANKTNSSIGAWKCNFSPFKKTMTVHHPTVGHTGHKLHIQKMSRFKRNK